MNYYLLEILKSNIQYPINLIRTKLFFSLATLPFVLYKFAHLS